MPTDAAGAFCTKISPGFPCLNAKKTKSTASSRVIIKRVIFGSVIVNSLFELISSINRGITEPLDAKTLPYLVPQITVESSPCRDLATKTFYIIALEMPMALIGYTALSVLKQITRLTFVLIAAVSTFSVPIILVLTASIG